MEYKLIYLAKRNPAIAKEDFPEAWRSHSQLASKFVSSLGSHFRSVRQCIKIWEEKLPESFQNEHDGSAILEMKSYEDMQAARSHPRSQDEMKTDEVRVFADYVEKWTMPCEGHILLDRGAGEFVLLSFLMKRSDLDIDQFFQQLKSDCENLAQLPGSGEQITRLVVNKVIELRDPPYDFSAIVEIWFANLDDAYQAAGNTKIIEALEQKQIAYPERGARLLARINLEKSKKVGADGETEWDSREGKP